MRRGVPLEASPKRWETTPVEADTARQIAGALGMPPAVARVLAGRGLSSPDAVRHFVDPRLGNLGDPFALPDMDRAVARIGRAVSSGERITVYGDYDVDGVTGTALLARVLACLGADVSTFLPHRLEEGYGLGEASLARCLAAHEPDLIVCVDCGTGAVEPVAAAARAGIDVVVTDHHEPRGEPAPACAVVNPKLGDDEDLAGLAGVGVAFKLCHALVKDGMQRGDARAAAIDLRLYLDLVALGTVADVVPLRGENRILVRHGLVHLEKSDYPGIAALKRVGGVKGGMNAYHIAFVLGPRLNAAGRLGDAERALELLMTADVGRADALAAELDLANRERKEIEDRILRAAELRIEASFDPSRDFGLVVSEPAWHVGTVGIVASRLCGAYHRPAIVIGADGNGRGKGSCRSIASLDLMGVLDGCADLLESYGGHAMAAGVTVAPEHVEALRERFNGLCRERLDGTDLRPVQRIDAWVNSLGEIDARLHEAVETLRPFGLGNPTPVLGAREVRLVEPARPVGRSGDHLKMTLASGGSKFDAIAFGLGRRAVGDGALDVAFSVEINEFRGRRALQLRVRDFRPAEDAREENGLPAKGLRKAAP